MTRQSPSHPGRSEPQRPVRAGVFAEVAHAEVAVRNLLQAGFTRDEITVVSSDETKERHFREFEHQEPAGTFTPATAAVGGGIGALLGGVTAVIGLSTGVGAPLVAAGAFFAAAGGGVAGTLIGALMSRGVEKEVADYYDQAVTQGNLLVAVEHHDPEKLATAERILAEAGSHPLQLMEG
ncbi:MAG: hypothetical protein WD066_07730 [Planctomycetaceae bacterium]